MSTEPRRLINLHRTISLVIVAFLACSETVTMEAITMEYQGHQHLKKVIGKQNRDLSDERVALPAIISRAKAAGLKLIKSIDNDSINEKVEDPVAFFGTKFTDKNFDQRIKKMTLFESARSSIHAYFEAETYHKPSERALERAYDMVIAILSENLKPLDFVKQINVAGRSKIPGVQKLAESQIRRFLHNWIATAKVLTGNENPTGIGEILLDEKNYTNKFNVATLNLLQSGSPSAAYGMKCLLMMFTKNTATTILESVALLVRLSELQHVKIGISATKLASRPKT
ncbi:hypothetical protein Plhal304r1_c007g0027251 [Plasmopara halstedii]